MAQADRRDIAPALTDVPATPAASMATQPGRIPLDKLVLIGTAGQPQNRLALLREKTGEILAVRLGDKTPAGHVQAIGDGELFLSHRGKVVRLGIPGS